ncbi:MAG: T9SS type A sorting domain-containing protein [Bacteroidota bacterium]
MKRKLHKIYALLVFCTVIGTHITEANTGRYRLTIRSNPATSITIGWDQISGSNPIVYYGTTDYGTNWSAYPNSKSPSRIVSSKGMNNHFTRLTGLQSNRAYYFVIRDSQGTSQRFWFKTAPSTSSERLSFIAGGDSRNNRTPRINANKLVSKLRPHAVFFGGDMTSSDTNSQWINWFNDWQYTIGSDGRMIPIVAARGNHEGSNSSIYNLFDTPSSSVYYALTFGGDLIRSYTLNTEMSISGSQTNWLNSDLAANSGVKWKMAQYHKPMRPHVSSKSEGSNQYNYWSQSFYNNNVKLVVESDAHTVKTTWPVRPSTSSGSDEGFTRDDERGTVYVGEGCWGAPLRTNNDNKDWTRNSGRFNQFKWIFVDLNKIEVRTIKVDNANSVGTVSDNNIFAPPANLDIWNPSRGAVVTISPNTGGGDGGNTTTTISKRVVRSYDDAEEAVSGKMYRTSSDLELVYDSYQSAGNQRVGMRFTGLSIPSGVTIENAYIQFTTDETSSGSSNLTIRGHDVNDSWSFGSSNYDISNRSLTSASVSWSPSSWTSVGQAGSGQRTPDIKSIIQEIVNRSGWNSGNDISIIINGSGKRTAESYNGSRSRAPLLVVEYQNENNNTFARAGSGAYVTNILAPQTDISGLLLYPNPVHNLLHIELKEVEAGTDANILIYSISGEIVHAEDFKVDGLKMIDMQNLKLGTYLINIVAKDKAYFQKVIKD